jgi:hypothetical protein
MFRKSSHSRFGPRVIGFVHCGLYLTAICLCSWSCVAQVHAGSLALGGNINERFQWATPEVLDQTHTTWLRGFVPASEFMSGRRSYQTDPGLQALNRAAASGRKIVLSIKWDSTGKGGFGRMPEEGSPKEQETFAFVDHLLDATQGRLAALVLINELTIDTLPEDLAPGAGGRLPVIAFLRRLAEHIDAEHRKAADGIQLPLYGGGMTRLDLPKTQQSLPTRLMVRWVNEDPKITGADFHMHQPDMRSTESALEFMHRAIPNKPLMVTEMSLVFKWKQHLGDRMDDSEAGRVFAQQHSIRPGTLVAEFLNDCYQRPVPEQEWQQFLASQQWFEPHYLAHLIPMLQSNGARIATYALTWNPHPDQAAGRATVSVGSVPWFLNQLLVPGMADVPGANRLPENYGFFADYVKYQHQRR